MLIFLALCGTFVHSSASLSIGSVLTMGPEDTKETIVKRKYGANLRYVLHCPKVSKTTLYKIELFKKCWPWGLQTYVLHICLEPWRINAFLKSTILYNVHCTTWWTRYECGIARKFLSEESETTYDERWMTCSWNKSWTPTDTLDKCVWVQCINPPEVNMDSY